MTFVDIGRGDGPIEYVTIGGYGTVFSTYAVGSDLSVQSSTLDNGPAMTFSATNNYGMPNPSYTLPTALSAQESAAGFRVHFENTASFDFVVGTQSGSGCCEVRVKRRKTAAEKKIAALSFTVSF